MHADEALKANLSLVTVGHQHVVRRPTDSAGEVRDLDRRLAIDFALHIPVQHLRLGVRKRGVQNFQFIRIGQETQLDRRWVDQRISPTKLQRVTTFFETDLPGLTYECDIFRVVDR